MRKVAFLDRDGTINVDHGYVHKPEDWEFTEQAIEALGKLQQAGFALAVVTNQSGIGRGRYSMADVERVHRHLRDCLGEQDIQLDAVAFCPHTPDDDCLCRKPRTGMADQIAAELNASIDFPASWTIGDKPSDVGFGKGLGTNTGLIRGPHWQPGELIEQPNLIGNSLHEIVEAILAGA